MTSVITRETPIEAVRRLALPLAGGRDDFDPLLESIGNTPLVLIGEASHGTHEFYRIRAEITKRLITEAGFTAVTAEADWPDAYRVNRFVRGVGDDTDAADALRGFTRFPQWMWRNADVLDFVGWLRSHNEAQPDPQRQVGFYGLDLYSLHASIDAVLRYLDTIDPDAAARARARYACFDRFGGDLQAYGYAASLGLRPSCETEVVAQLVDLRQSANSHLRHDHRVTPDDAFYAEQNARLVANAERYYRTMFGSHVASWNLRDQHMVETLDALRTFLARSVPAPKVVVWAHNSHLGDARATERSRAGEYNVGQLVRQGHPGDAYLVGFSTYRGTVTAATDWDEPAARRNVRPALPESYEALFHEAEGRNFLMLLSHGAESGALRRPHLQRAIGVVYRPDTERQSHYYHARLPDQFDAMLHYDVTRAVEPLDRTGEWERGEAPETYPSAL